jgi:7,8-dihydroneopterin aldolase/epimerase/oxygenase
MPRPLEITLRNMQFHVCVGVFAHEEQFAQRLEVDLTVWSVPPAGSDLGVDYSELYAITRRVVETPPLRYLESIGRAIVDLALAQPTVIGARVAVRKPQVPLPGPLDAAEVVVEDGRRT